MEARLTPLSLLWAHPPGELLEELAVLAVDGFIFIHQGTKPIAEGRSGTSRQKSEQVRLDRVVIARGKTIQGLLGDVVVFSMKLRGERAAAGAI